MSRPKVQFDVSKEAAVHNFDLFKKVKFNLRDILHTKVETSVTTYVSELKDIKMLEKLFKHHHIWKDLKLIIKNGSKSITQKEVSIPNTVQPQQATIIPPIPKGSPLPKPLVAVKMSRDKIEQCSIVQAVKELLAFSSPLSIPKVQFDVSKEAAVHNFDLFKQAKFNLSDILNPKGETSVTTYGSKFKDIKMTEKLFKNHHRWKDLKLMIQMALSGQLKS